jgi:hypothetical protein
MLWLDYESDSFPPTVLPDGHHRLSVAWDDVLWAAVPLGRPDIFHVFRHGQPSVYEAIFRWSIVRMALQQRGRRVQKLVRSDAFKQMDPTEKGAVNYFLGLVVCKLFASKLLDSPWTLHLDVFRAALNPRLFGGRSRPDMVAQSISSQAWHAFECKGRALVPSSAEKQRAKAQAQQLVSVRGTRCTLHVGAITFFRNDTLEFFWRDPDPVVRERIEIPDPGPTWRAYYSPFVETYQSRTLSVLGRLPPVSVQEMDLTIGMHPVIAPLLLEGDWQRAREVARERRDELASDGYQADGFLVKAGPSWHEPLEQSAIA